MSTYVELSPDVPVAITGRIKRYLDARDEWLHMADVAAERSQPEEADEWWDVAMRAEARAFALMDEWRCAPYS